MRMARNAVLGLLALAALIAVTLLDLAPPAPLPKDAPSGSFSAARAFAHVEDIARAPHPIGSAEHDRVREHLVSRLRDLGLDTRVQEAVGALPIAYDGVVPVGRVRNIVAVRHGSAPTGRVVLAAHYDSVAASPGAADDGAGVATLLEVARALPASTRNDVVFLITDGEEPGLLGAEAFVREDPAAKGTVVVLNNEARGTRGTVTAFRASPGDGPLIDVYGSAAPHPSADSGFAALMGLLPNNTDFHVFGAAGWLGLDAAFTGGGAHYHTPLDDPAHLDQGTLQQMGDNTLAVTRALASADLAALGPGAESIHFTVPGLLVRYPAWLELPVALAGLVVAGWLVATLRGRCGIVRPGSLAAEGVASPDAEVVTVPRVLAAAGLALLPVLAAGAAGYALWPLLGVLRPEYTQMFTGDPYRPWLYQAALVSVTAAVVPAWRLLAGRLSGRRLGPASLGAGALLLVAVLGVAAAVVLPRGSHPMAWSALLAAAGGVAARRVPAAWRPVVLTVGLAPTAILLGASAISSLDIGLRLGGPASALNLALLMLLLLPLAEPLWSRRAAALLPAVAVVASAALVAGGLAADRFDAAHPRQTRLVYAMDEATGTAVWGSADGEPSAESAHYFGEPHWAVRPARPAPMRPPGLTVVDDTTSGALRTLTLRLTPTAGAPITGLSVEEGAVPITVGGRDLGERRGFAFHAPPGALTVTLVLPGGRARIRVFEQRHDLSAVPGFTPAADTVHMGPLATVFRVHTL